MNDHRFDPLTQFCVGCDLSASDYRDQPLDRHSRKRGCPARYELINTPTTGMIEIITAPDRLVLRREGGELVRFDATGARALIYIAGGSC